MGIQYNIADIANENNLIPLFLNLNAIAKWKCKSCNYIFDKPIKTIIYKTTAKGNIEKTSNKIKCEKCREKYILSYINSIAENKKGKLLSIKYSTKKSKYQFECKNNHKWETSIDVILSNHWCPYCSNLGKTKIEDIKSIATNRGGELLSIICNNNHDKLKFKCFNNHNFIMAPNKIKKGQWCPYCKTSISEEITRIYFETIFNNKFPKIKPPWLVNSDGFIMELDGFCNELNIAFEHNGKQHYSIVKKFKMSNDSFIKRLNDDKTKNILCKKHNVKLITINQLFEKTKIQDLKNIIKLECVKQNIELPNNFDEIIIDYNKAYINNKNKEYFIKLQNIAKEKGGEIISEDIVSSNDIIICKCKNQHVFKSKPTYIKSGYWCKQCCSTNKKNIDDIKLFANKIGLACLSKDYINQHEKLKFCCNLGHEFLREYKQLKRFPYCRECKK